MSKVVDLSERRSLPWPLLFVLGWTAVVILQTLVITTQLGVSFRRAFFPQAVEHYTLALLSLVMWRAIERLHALPLSAKIAAHAGLAIGIIGLWQGITLAYLRFAYGADFWQRIFAGTWLFQLVTIVMTYGTLAGAIVAIHASRRERERERRAAQLELTAREAELALVKAQLHPHFLFNSLHSIMELVDSDPPRAREMIVKLSELLHSTLRRIDLDQVPLDREIDLVRAYLDIEKIRFSSRLRVGIDVQSDAGAATVPPLLLQPLVENAVKHGIAPHPEGGEVRVSAAVEAGRLHVEIADSGDGTSVNEGTGRGLELTRRRLDGAYGSDYRLTFGRQDEQFVVRLDLPLAYA